MALTVQFMPSEIKRKTPPNVIHQLPHRTFINWRRESANSREGDFTTTIAAYARVIE
jgi:hypothetical protein